MYSKQQIIDTLTNEGVFIDNFLLDAFIKNWKIESIYEDAQGVEYFDDMAIEKVKNGIQKKQPQCEINIIDKDEIKPVDMAVEFLDSQASEQHEITVMPAAETETTDNNTIKELPVSLLNEVNKEVEKELKNVTLDISNQTLAVLAESIAKKITSDVSDFIKRTDFIEDAVQLGEYKKDNQLLLQKIDELIADNRLLIKKIEDLEKDSKSFVKLFGNIYIKN